MSTPLTYSILRYRHSQALGESLNVGVLFSFGSEHPLQFVTANTQRIKAAYPDFDNTIFQSFTKSLKQKLGLHKQSDLFPDDRRSFSDYIVGSLLPEDSSALQFSEPIDVVNPFQSRQQAIEELSRILLADVEVKRDANRHNESFILKKFTDSVTSRNINIEHRMSKNKLIEVKGVSLNFELSWKNGINHLIKPISFDLKEAGDIQSKSATYFGYLNLLTDYALSNDIYFDLLIGRPQERHLIGPYEDALYVLDRAHGPKSLVTEDILEEYAEETAKVLHTKDL